MLELVYRKWHNAPLMTDVEKVDMGENEDIVFLLSEQIPGINYLRNSNMTSQGRIQREGRIHPKLPETLHMN